MTKKLFLVIMIMIMNDNSFTFVLENKIVRPGKSLKWSKSARLKQAESGISVIIFVFVLTFSLIKLCLITALYSAFLF